MKKIKSPTKKVLKEMSNSLGTGVNELKVIISDLQKTGLIKHLENDEWRLYNGKEWHIFTM